MRKSRIVVTLSIFVAVFAVACSSSEVTNAKKSGFAIEAARIQGDAEPLIFQALAQGIEPVESVEWRVKDDNAIPFVVSKFYRRWRIETNFETCATLAETAAFADQDAKEIIILPRSLEFELARGRCALGTRVQEPSAPRLIALLPSGIGIQDRTSGNVLAKSPSAFLQDLWRLLDVGPAPIPLFDSTGSYRRPDPVTDEELVRALKSNRRVQKAALQTLAQRIDRNGKQNSAPPKFREIQSTGRVVGEQLAASNLLIDPDRKVRRMALNASASIPSAADVLTPQLIAALKNSVAPEKPDPAEAKWRARLGREMTGALGIGANDGGLPGYELWDIREAAGLAASHFGSDASKKFVEFIEPTVSKDSIAKMGSFHDGTIAAFAASGRGTDFALFLLDSPEQPYSAAMFRDLVLSMNDFAPELQSRIKSICGANTAAAPLNAVQCDVLSFREGDKTAVDRVAQRLIDATKPNSSSDLLLFSASNALLYDLGIAGQTKLREIVVSSDDAAALAAARSLCELGREDAGSKVVSRVKRLAAAKPEDSNLASIIQNCAGPERTMAGRFAL